MNKPVLFFKSHVDGFTRSDGAYVKPHETKIIPKKAAPSFGAHHAVLRAASDALPDRHMDKQVCKTASEHMRNGDHESLKGTLNSADTAQREKILDHVHPDHWDGLGFKPVDKAQRVNDYHKKFGGKPDESVQKNPSKRLEEEVGHYERERYGVYYKNGDKVKDQFGNRHIVSSHIGASVITEEGKNFHPTKLSRVTDKAPVKPKDKKSNQQLDPHPAVIGKSKKIDDSTFEFNGKTYNHTGKEGLSNHDKTPVKEAKSESGHRVWHDEKGRVHADSEEEARKFRGE